MDQFCPTAEKAKRVLVGQLSLIYVGDASE